MESEDLLKEKIHTIEEVVNYRNTLKKEKVAIEDKMAEVDKTLEHLWEILDICPGCNGYKKTFHRACAEDEGEDRSCGCCNGTGKFIKSKMELPQYKKYMYMR